MPRATDYDINQAGYVIHSAVHAARHDVDCIIHTQMLPGTRRRFGLLEWPALLRKLDRADPSYRD